jgi:hypothetical protein
MQVLRPESLRGPGPVVIVSTVQLDISCLELENELEKGDEGCNG